jgi:hypothetical protein
MRPGERGFVTLAALLDVLLITLIGSILMTSLLGEIQGENGYDRAVSAISVAEAGLHWGGNKLIGLVTGSYAGDADQTLQDAGGQQLGMFDVIVTCADRSAVSTGCTAAPNNRLIRATGYVPSKTSVLGQRTVQALVSQNTFFSKAVCGYADVNFDQGVTVQGDVGSEGTTSASLALQGPSGNAARIQPAPGGIQPGSTYTVGSTRCSQGCSGQVSGIVNNNQMPGTVCVNQTQVSNTYKCTPGGTALTALADEAVTISAANSSLSTLTIGARGTVTFVTTGAMSALRVNVHTIRAGKNTRFIIKGGGTVILNVQDQLAVDQGSYFGVDSLNNLLPASHLIVQSCNTGTPSPAVWFDRAGVISAVIIAPYGNVQIDAAQLSQGAVLASRVHFDQGTSYRFDGSASTVGFGFNKVRSWQDVP